MEEEDWIERASKYLQEVYRFDSAFALQTAKVIYENLPKDSIEQNSSIKECVDEELSYWGD